MKTTPKNARKKVLFIATVDSHIELFHLPFLKLLKSKGYEVHVATNTDKPIKYCDKKIALPIRRSPFSLKNLVAIRKLRRIIQAEKYDLIEANTPMGGVVGRLAAKKARKTGTRVIYMAHGLHFYRGAPLINWLLFYPVEKYLAKYTDTMILINQEDYDLAQRKFKKCLDVQYVPGVGIDPKKFQKKLTPAKKHALRTSLGLKDDDFVMICVGRLDKNKNQGFLISATRELLKKSDKYHLLLVGPDEFGGKYQKQAKDIAENVHFLGGREDIADLLAISDVAVSASLREGLPVNILEAMAASLPVVATDARGVRDLLSQYSNGTITPEGDENSLSSAVCCVQKHTKIQTKMDKIFLADNVLKSRREIHNRIMKPRVIHMLSSQTFSGAENVACTLIENMRDGYNMYYCCPHGDIDVQLRKREIKHIDIDRLSIMSIRKVIKTYHPDIVHAHDFKASCLAAFSGYNGKIISHLHQNPGWVQKINMKTIAYLIACARFDTIVAVSGSFIKDFKFSRKITKKIKKVNNYIDGKRTTELSNERRSVPYDFCFFGRLEPDKNPLEFLAIIKTYSEITGNDCRCCMIGSGKLKKQCLSYIKENLAGSQVDMLGFVENPFPIVKNSRFVIMPSAYEGFGMAAIESTILKKPVINSGVGGLSEIFRRTGLIAKDRNDYVKKICLNEWKLPDISKYTNRDRWLSQFNAIYNRGSFHD